MRCKTSCPKVLGARISSVESCETQRKPALYQRADVILIRQIRSLLYDNGFTIGGARQRSLARKPKQITMSANKLSSNLERNWRIY